MSACEYVRGVGKSAVSSMSGVCECDKCVCCVSGVCECGECVFGVGGMKFTLISVYVCVFDM